MMLKTTEVVVNAYLEGKAIDADHRECFGQLIEKTFNQVEIDDMAMFITKGTLIRLNDLLPTLFTVSKGIIETSKQLN